MPRRYFWVLLMFLGAVSIHVQESMYRMHFLETFFSWKAQFILQPIYYVGGWTLFWGFRKAQSFLSAWAVFIFFIVISRTIINFYVGEPWNGAVIFGLVLMVFGLALTMQNKNNPKLIVGGLLVLLVGIVYSVRLLPKARLAEATVSWWMLYLFIASVTIATFENISRKGIFEKYFSWRTQRIMIPLNMVTNCALFYGYGEAQPTFIFAWAVYTVFDVLTRVVNNKLLGEPFLFTHGLGMTVVIVGTALSYFGGLG